MRRGESFTSFQIVGQDLSGLSNEVGGHRVQRVPPTEKRGRVHTSTVTVAVLESESDAPIDIEDSDFRVQWFSGTGKGGQHRNKHQNSCRVTHEPTGLTESRQGRHREANLTQAMAALRLRIQEQSSMDSALQRSQEKRRQVGSGMRGDKTVTIRFQDDKAVNHITGKSTSAAKYMKGFMDKTW